MPVQRNNLPVVQFPPNVLPNQPGVNSTVQQRQSYANQPWTLAACTNNGLQMINGTAYQVGFDTTSYPSTFRSQTIPAYPVMWIPYSSWIFGTFVAPQSGLYDISWQLMINTQAVTGAWTNLLVWTTVNGTNINQALTSSGAGMGWGSNYVLSGLDRCIWFLNTGDQVQFHASQTNANANNNVYLQTGQANTNMQIRYLGLA